VQGTCIDNPENFTNKIFDCGGNTIRGNASGSGINLSSKSNNTIMNCIFVNFTYGIYLNSSENNSIVGNIFTKAPLYFEGVNNTNISTNLIENSPSRDAIGVYSSINVSILGNVINWTEGNYGVYFSETNFSRIEENILIETRGISINDSMNNFIHKNNITDGIYAGVIPSGCKNDIIQGNIIANINGSSTDYGIYIIRSTNETVVENIIEGIGGTEIGIQLEYHSDNNVIFNNTILSNIEDGIALSESKYNNITYNFVWGNSDDGIDVDPGSNYSYVAHNTVVNNSYGIVLTNVSHSSILNNTLTQNIFGSIVIYETSINNSITNNTVSEGSFFGILEIGAQFNKYTNNTIESVFIGMYSNVSLSSNFANNTLLSNAIGFLLQNSTNITMVYNNINGSLLGFGVAGEDVVNFYHDINTTNKINGKPIYYWTNQKYGPNNCRNSEINETSNAGFVALVSCDNITLKNLNLSSNFEGFFLANTSNATIMNISANNNIIGGLLFSSQNNTLIGVSTNSDTGIEFFSSSYNRLFNFTVNSEHAFASLADSVENIANNFDVGYKLNFVATDISLDKASSAGNDIERGIRYLNITNESADSWIFINISYPESEDPSKLFLARWNNSAWETDASKFTSAHGINSDEKYYYANITKFSLFVLFVEQAPSISLSLSSSSIYVGNSITVSCSATDGSGVASVTATSSDGTTICSGTSSCSGTYKPSAVGTKTITCTAVDTRGNEGSSSATLTVYSPISKSATHVSSTSSIQASASTNKVSAGQSVSYNLSIAPNLPLITVSVTFANALSGISLTASKIAAPPADAPAVPGIPFAYVKVEKNGFKDSDLSSTTLDFKVEKAWIDENGIDPAKVSAYRLENNTWTMLTTTKSNEDDKYIYYSAVSPSGLSIFAISGEKKTVAPPSEEKPSATGEAAKPSMDYTWLGLLAIVIVAAGAGYYLLSKKGGKGKKAK